MANVHHVEFGPNKDLAQTRCPKCGTLAHPTCDCGETYVPAKEYLAAAMLKNPEMKNLKTKEVAEATGVPLRTVQRIKKFIAPNGAPVVNRGRFPPAIEDRARVLKIHQEHPNWSQEKIGQEIGRSQGFVWKVLKKSNGAAKTKSKPKDNTDWATFLNVFGMNCGASEQLAKAMLKTDADRLMAHCYKPQTKKRIITAARRAADAWINLADALENMYEEKKD